MTSSLSYMNISELMLISGTLLEIGTNELDNIKEQYNESDIKALKMFHAIFCMDLCSSLY